MKSVIKHTGFLALGCALSLTVLSCGNNSSKTTTADTTAVATPAAPADTSANNTANNNASSNKDANFVSDVSVANAKEMAWLQAGIDNGGKDVKDHAKMMMKDHQGLAQTMKDYAAKKNITLPPDQDYSKDVDMGTKKGKDWDKAWADKMVDAHQQTIDKFQQAQNDVSDPDLKTIITNTLPTLHKHLDMCKVLQAKM
jgi:putative membrane protein